MSARPYRAAMPWLEARALMQRHVPSAICADSFDALCAHMDRAERDAGLREAA
jgi:hypothetical protein